MGDPQSDSEHAIEALHSTARSFMQAQVAETVAEIAVDAITAILDLPANTVFLYDEATDQLQPVAWTAQTERLIGPVPTFGPGDGLAWQVYETGDPRIYDDVSSAEGRFNPDTPVGSEIILPLANHGVLLIGSDEAHAFDERDISLAKIVAAHMMTALDRIEREQELRHQNQRLDEFASVVSHDLMNPLTIAQGRLEMLREEYDRDNVESAKEAIERSVELVDELRSLARIGQPVEDPEPVDLAAIGTGCWRNVKTHEASLVVNTERRIRADPSRLKQLLENAFRNAVEHGGKEVTVTVGDLEGGFYIADDGPGFSETDREKVFETGYSTKDEGTGFGLGIIQEIARAHDWEVNLTDSDTGGGRIEVTGL